jgi:choline-phosphate cytidylyltransferase
MTTRMDSSTTASPTNSQPIEHAPYPKRILHSKRSFHRAGSIDSPAYDASEEDNDPTTDDGTSSASSLPVSHQKSRAVGSHSNPLKVQNKKHQQVIDDDDPGLDSPTYDGDVESYTTAGHQHISQRESAASLRDAYSSSESTVSTMTSPTPLPPDSSHRPPTSSPLTRNETTPEPPKSSPKESFDPAKATPEEIQKWVKDVIAGHSEGAPAFREYKINPPPTNRPIVIYADGTFKHSGASLYRTEA